MVTISLKTFAQAAALAGENKFKEGDRVEVNQDGVHDLLLCNPVPKGAKGTVHDAAQYGCFVVMDGFTTAPAPSMYLFSTKVLSKVLNGIERARRILQEGR